MKLDVTGDVTLDLTKVQGVKVDSVGFGDPGPEEVTIILEVPSEDSVDGLSLCMSPELAKEIASQINHMVAGVKENYGPQSVD